MNTLASTSSSRPPYLPLCWHDIRILDRTTILQALGLGVLLNIAMLIWVYALSISISMGEGAFIISSAALLSPLLAWALFRQRPDRAFWIAFPIALIGIACLSLTAAWRVEIAQLFFLSSAGIFSLHFNLNKHFTGKVRTLPLVCMQLFSAGCFSFVMSMFLPQQDIQMTATTWGWLVVVILLSTSLRYVLQTTGQYRISTASAAIMMILEPVWVLLLGMMVYGEQLPLQKFIGCGLIVVALLTYRRLAPR